MADGDIALGIDFGTSNTVLAVAAPGEPSRVIRFAHGGTDLTTFMTALCYWQERVQGVQTTKVEAGPFAVDAFLQSIGSLRFIQSFKTFAASATFQETRIFGAKVRFEDLLAAFLRIALRHAGVSVEGRRIVMGRPVRFAGGQPDAALALSRYATALERLGVADVAYVYEPVGAAFFFARGLNRDATVLVADFGGGTSDFSVMRFEAGPDGRRRARPLGHSGIGIAGDTFDYRFIDHVVSPQLGKEASYRSFGKQLPIPRHFFANFARWNQLSMMKANGDLKELLDLAKASDQREALERFAEIVEYDLGFELYRAVSTTKRALSEADRAPFAFKGGGVSIDATVTRTAFEGWIAEDVARIDETMSLALSQAGLKADGIDKVFLTGGTSFIPAIRQLFLRRFGAERILSGEEFESIAAGLALIGQSPDIAAWSTGMAG